MRAALRLLRRFVREREGATMIIGTWMALGLVGAVWYVIGIGDALVYRDHVQEAADSVAFSAAVVHARGMNFISAVNLVMLALVALFLLIRVFEDFLSKLLDMVTGWPGMWCMLQHPGDCCGVGPNPGPVAFDALVEGQGCTIAEGVKKVHDGTKDVRKIYESDLGKVLPALGKVESTVSNIVAPVGAIAAGVTAGAEYGELGIPVSAAMIPLRALQLTTEKESVRNALGGTDIGGLPTEKRPFHDMCWHVGQGVMEWIEHKIEEALPPLGAVLQAPIIRNVVQIVNGAIAGSMANDYCSEEEAPWDESGFRVMNQNVAQNGHDLLQIWSFVRSTEKDPSGKIVAVGTLLSPTAPPPSTSHTYVAQAEYYFDCSAAWNDPTCNGTFYEWHAMFEMKWKARLKRVKKPDIAGDAVDEVTNGVQNVVSKNPILGADQSLPDYGKDQAFNFVFNGATNAASGYVRNKVSSDGYIGGIIH